MKKPREPARAHGVQVTNGADPTPLSPIHKLRITGDEMRADFPEWGARAVLAEALRAVGLPLVLGAMYRRPSECWMSYDDTLQAIALDGLVVAEARRRLPPGLSGAVIADEFRVMSWRCVVAGMALLDADELARLVGRRDDEPELPAEAEPRPQVAEAAVAMPTAPMPFRIYREGEVPSAS